MLPISVCWSDIRGDLVQRQNLYHPTTVTSPPTHSGSWEYVGAVIRCSLWWYQLRSEFSFLPSSHKKPTFPGRYLRPCGETGLPLLSTVARQCSSLLPGAVSQEAYWKTRVGVLDCQTSIKDKITPHPPNQDDLNLCEKRQWRSTNAEMHQIWQLSDKDFELAFK